MYTSALSSFPRIRPSKLPTPQGFTLFEVMVVVAIIGVLSAVAFYALQRHARDAATKDAVITVAGTLREARDQARHDGTPRLVYFAAPTGCAGGEHPPIARIVTDRDVSYSETPGDLARELRLPAGTPCDVNVYGAEPEAPYQEENLPTQVADICAGCKGLSLGLGVASVALDGGGLDVSVGGLSIGLGLPLGGGGGAAAAPAAAPASSGPDYFGGSILRDLDHGSTFPRDPATNQPAIAFTPNGSVVATSHPYEWGSGAGAVFLTDNERNVFAITLTPGANIDVLRHTPEGEWR